MKFLLTKRKRVLMYLVLALLSTTVLISMIYYQYKRQDPLTINIRNSSGTVSSQVVYTQPSETVEQVIAKADLPEEAKDYLCHYSLEDYVGTASAIEIYEPISGTITVDDQVIEYSSGAHTISEVLKENGIEVSPVDIISPSLSCILSYDNANITITRVSNAIEEKTEVIPYAVESEENPNLPYKETTIIQKGQTGHRDYTEEVIYSQGQEVERNIISDTTVEPVTERVQVGTNLEIGKPNIKKGDIEGWRPYVVLALQKNGLEPTEDRVSRVLRQINTESAGDQNADQEIFDINSIIGQEAKGLMQTTPYTFNYYHFDGYDDIYNGYHNLLAAINYAKEAYGDNLSGIGLGGGY